MQIVLVLIGIAAGLAIGWLLGKNRSQASNDELRLRLVDADKVKTVLAERTATMNSQLTKTSAELNQERQRASELSVISTQLKTTNEHLVAQLSDQKAELENLQVRFSKEFENLANRIFEEKSTKFVEQNRNHLDLILNPLKEKIHAFEQKVDESYKTEAAERNSLKGEIKSLVMLNKQISEDANNLAKALKGDSKKQGNWGEIILEKILERSGLEKGREYDTQVSMTNEEGRRFQPDVIVYLPDKKHIVIDAKVSLIAYEAFVNCTTDEDREQFIGQHISSVKGHINDLGKKNYQDNSKLDSPDFVLMFMPIESSFSTALQADNELFSYAWDRRIVIVSPATLLATLRTIASIWKQERQTRNALEIAEQGGKLYDKFVAFIDDLVIVGKKMDEAKNNYADAMKKLSEGRGNLIGSAEKLKQLGIKSSKNMSSALLERATEE